MLARRRNFVHSLGPVFISALVLAGWTPGLVRAQQGSTTVTGFIVDARDGRPLGGAVVHVRGSEIAVVADARGQFRLTGLDAGEHTLTISRTGFSSRGFGFQVGDVAVADLGSIPLQVSTNALATVTGVVRDATTAEPVPQVPIDLNGNVVAITDNEGRFRIVTGSIDRTAANRLTVRRIGYAPVERTFELASGQDAVDFLISIESAAVRLTDIAVESDAVALTTGRMTGFYRRRDIGLGYFFTRDQIKAIGAQKVTDVVRRVPGTVIFSEESVNVDPTNPGANPVTSIPISIVFRRSGFARAGEPCTPLIFVNDMVINTTDFDYLLPANQIAGMEVYTGASQIPAEYNRRGSECGVIVVWSDAPEGVRGRLAELELGGFIAARVSEGSAEGERIGVQLSVPIVGLLEFHPAFNIIFGRADGFNNAGWQALGNFKVRPLGQRSPFYVGAGGSFSRVRESFGGFDSAFRPIENRAADVLLVGASFPLGPLRPFVDFQLLDLLTAGRTEGYLVTGFSVRSGNRDRPRAPGMRAGR